MHLELACFILCQFMAARQLSIVVADGPMHHIKAPRTGPQVSIRLARRGVLWRLIFCPDIAFGESYMDGDGQIESGSIDDLVALLIANYNQWNRHWFARLMLAFDTRLSRFSTLNFPDRSRRNVARNYDLKDSFFDTFLDP